jgi:hypothetical protein
LEIIKEDPAVAIDILDEGEQPDTKWWNGTITFWEYLFWGPTVSEYLGGIE